jgi:predicted  nucleic acid-binding Zn ribbon protein
MHALSNNPIHCIDCNLEVAAEVLALESELIDELVAWRSLYDSIYRLWLDSGAYEAWARGQLTNIQSAVNTQGLALRAAMERVRACYYWYFQDQAAENFTPDQHCPICHQLFMRYDKGIFVQFICDHCKIITTGL